MERLPSSPAAVEAWVGHCALVAEGCHVAACDVINENLAETRALCEHEAPQGLRVNTFRCDVSNDDQVNAFAKSSKENWVPNISICCSTMPGLGAAEASSTPRVKIVITRSTSVGAVFISRAARSSQCCSRALRVTQSIPAALTTFALRLETIFRLPPKARRNSQ